MQSQKVGCWQKAPFGKKNVEIGQAKSRSDVALPVARGQHPSAKKTPEPEAAILTQQILTSSAPHARRHRHS